MAKRKTNLEKMRDAEKRAKRKLNRLRGRGFSTGAISPIRPVDTSNRYQVQKYTKELEAFISRSNRFVLGYDGTPIPYVMWSEYKKLEKEWNKRHREYWDKFGEIKFMTSKGETDMTLAQRSAMAGIPGLTYGSVRYERELNPSSVRGVTDLIRRAEILEKELDPNYITKRTEQLRGSLLQHVASFNSPELKEMIENASTGQLYRLHQTTDFVNIYFRYMSTGVNVVLDAADQAEYDRQLEHLIETMRNVMELPPIEGVNYRIRTNTAKSGKYKNTKSFKMRVYGNMSKSKAKEFYKAYYESLK